MKIPESVRIGGVDYKIIEVPFLNNGKELCYGHIDFEKALIEFTTTIPVNHQHKCITMWHEILHGISRHADIEIENEEAVIVALSKGIYQVLQDNGRALFDMVPLKTD